MGKSPAVGRRIRRQPAGISVSRISGAALHEFCKSRNDVSVFQSGYAHDIYLKTEGCNPAAWKAEDDSGKILGTILGVRFKESKLIPPFLSSHVSVRGGPVFGNATASEKVSRDLLAAVVNGCKDALYVRCYPTPLQIFPVKAAEESGYIRERWLNVSLDLEGKTSAQLEKGLGGDKRRGIKRAQRGGVTVETGETADEMDTFYQLLKETASQKGFRLQDKSLFNTVIAQLVPKGIARLLLARLGKETIAGRLVLFFNGIATDWYAASTDEANRLYANDLLVWMAIKWALENGGRCYDLGGAGRSIDEYGVGQFKERFGGVTVDTGRYTWTRSPVIHGVVDRAERLRSRVMRRPR